MLRGPESRDFCPDFDIFPEPDREWLDGDAMLMNLGVYEWKKGDEEVILFIYESDPGGIGRSHDMIACFRVSRLSTINNLSVISDDYRRAKDDAINNCRKRGITRHKNIWSDGLNTGIPKMFLQIITE